ncbi:MAG: hypothetical protein V3U13_08260 [Gemmatimonadota bacterium]
MRRVLLLALVAIPVLGLSGPATAQEAEEYGPPEMFWVYQEYVKPAMLQEYEAATKDLIDLLASSQEATSSIEFITISGSEFSYSYVIPVEGFGGIDEAWKSWQAAMEAAGRDKFSEIEARTAKAIDHAESSVLMLRADLSYMVEATALTADKPFRMYHYWYAIPGKESELEGVAKEFAALYKAKGIDHGWRIYQAVMGPDLPMYLVVETAADEADYHATVKKVEEMAGEEGMKLNQKALKFARNIVIQHGWIRPDLSFPQTLSTSSRE